MPSDTLTKLQQWAAMSIMHQQVIVLTCTLIEVNPIRDVAGYQVVGG